MSRLRLRTRAALVVMALGLAAPLAGCGQGPTPPDADLVAQLRDFHIDLSKASVEDGHVVLGLENEGPTVHELVVVRTDRPGDELPIAADGVSVDEDARGFRVLGEEEHVRLDEQEVMDLVLEPGHYVFFCNLEGHYLGGMHADLEVT
ncbi:MAG: hypothetical protein U0P45_02570 [Acidimicrobiales bacterium]